MGETDIPPGLHVIKGNCVSSAGAIMSAPRAVVFVMPYGEVKTLFESWKCVRSNWKQFLVQRMTGVYCAPLACLDQVAGEALFGKAETDCADCSPSFRRPAERQPADAASRCRKQPRGAATCNVAVNKPTFNFKKNNKNKKKHHICCKHII